MAQSIFPESNPPTRRIAATPRSPLGTLTVGVFFVLLIFDILSPPGPPLTALIGIVAYSAKTAIGVPIVVFGAWALITTRLPFFFKIATVLYCLVAIIWFLIWILTPPSGRTMGDSALTYLLNPTYSIWSWLMILLVPLVARFNSDGQITNAIARIPLSLGLSAVVIPALGMSLLHWNVNASNSAVAMLFMLACRQTRAPAQRHIHFALSIVVFAAMMISGYRIYALAALLFAANTLIPQTRKLLILQMIAVSISPFLFEQIIGYLVSKDNPLFFDTRSFLFKELLSDFSSTELWTGRGIDGRYFSPYFLYLARHTALSVGYNNILRTTSEIGWLNIILHYGVQGLIPFYVAVLAPCFANTRNVIKTISVRGIYSFLPVMGLLFAGELWNVISVSYFSWYIALGAMLTLPLSSARRLAERSLPRRARAPVHGA